MNSQPRLAFPAFSILARAPLRPRGEDNQAARCTRSIPIPSRTHPAASSRSLRSSRRPGAHSARTTGPVVFLPSTTLTFLPSTCPQRTQGTYAHGWTARRAAPSLSRGRARRGKSSWSRSSAISAGRSHLKSADSTSTRPPLTSWSRLPRRHAS